MRRFRPAPVQPGLYLALGIAQAAHSTEEYLTRLVDKFPVVTGYLHKVAGFFPVVTMTERTFVVLNIGLIVFLLSVSPFVFQRRPWALRVARVAAVVEALNGFAHLFAAVYTGGYYPGALSAVGLLLVAGATLGSSARASARGQSRGL